MTDVQMAGVFLLTYLIHSTIAIVVIAAAVWRLTCLQAAELRVIMWKLSLTMPLVTATATTVFDVPHFGLQVPLTWSAEDAQPAVDATAVWEYHMPVTDRASDTALVTPNMTGEMLNENVAATSRSPRAADSGTTTITIASSERSSVWLAAGVAWLVAIFFGFAKLGVQLRRLWRLRNTAAIVDDPEIQSQLNGLRRQLNIRRPVDLIQSANVTGPMTAGIRRPFIVLPVAMDLCPEANSTAAATSDSDTCSPPVDDSAADDGAVAGPAVTEAMAGESMSASPKSRGITCRPGAAEYRALLAHELVHVARRDAVWNLIVQIVSRAFPIQPLNVLAGRRLRREMDFVADSLAAQTLGERTGLLRCLVRLGDQLTGRPSDPAGCSALTACMATLNSTLGQRVEALLDADPRPRHFDRTARTVVVLLVVCCAFLTASVVPRAVARRSAEASNSEVVSPVRNSSMNKQMSMLMMVAGLAFPASADEPQTKAAVAPAAAELKTTPDAIPEGVARFNGMLVGRLAAKDVERGTFVVRVDAVPRVWRNSKAKNPKSLVGRTIEVSGVTRKFLDVLVVTRIGETIEFECRHDGDGLVFPGELLRKVAPYDPADYPELPEEFRGFRGAVVADIVKKDPETFEMILKVQRVTNTWKENAAKQVNAIEGRQLMLAGFWNRKDAYHSLKVGDRIEVGMQHIGLRSDHLTVAEFVRKSEAGPDRPAMKKEGEAAAADGFTRETRGFRGMLVGRLVEKDVERGTFAITVDAVPRVWKNNKASSPKSFLGQNVPAEGVTGRMLDALVVARIGDTIEFGALHDGGDRVRVGEVLRKVAPVKPGDYPVLPDGFRGFRGMVIAKVIRKDDHLMDLVVQVSRIKDTFDGSRAKDAESIIGERAMLAGFWQRKDAFHSISVGDTIECGVEHPERLSDHLTVIESVKKVEHP
ncbi:MAG: M56 family metallopeptidase [Fuerstiella sp.]